MSETPPQSTIKPRPKQNLSIQIASRAKQKKTPTEFIPKCVSVGAEYKLGQNVFIGKREMFKTEMLDYTLITDAQFEPSRAPKRIKPLLKNWVFKLHVDQTLSSVITRSVLRDRAIGGQILAYQYSECSIAGNTCVYYGFIPTIKKQFKDSHADCYIAATSVWPRKLFIFLKSGHACNCSKGCSAWSYTSETGTNVENVCIEKIKWGKLYIIMGEVDSLCIEMIKSVRQCVVCAQCFDCSNSTEYCRKHKTCKHKTAKPLDQIFSVSGSKIKKCKKY